MTAKIKTAGKNPGLRHPHKPRGISHKAFKKVYWPYIPVVLIICLLLAIGTQAGAIQTIIRHPDGKVLSYATSMSVSGLLADTNAARAQNGVAALNLNDKLDAAAQASANDMATRDYWSHNTPEGNPPWVWVTAQGYSYQKLGQNLAAGFSDEQSTINGWMASPPHRENLLDPAFADVGFGYANNPDYTAAGGGPMTIVVAFYGEPQVLAAQSTAPATSTSPPVQSTPTPTPAPTSQPQPTPKVESKTPAPTTQSPIKSGSLSSKSSRAQVAFANLPWAKFGTSLAVLGSFAAIGVWLSRHALALRRALVMGESFAIRHPLMDIGLLVIAALSFLLTQTAGFIQ